LFTKIKIVETEKQIKATKNGIIDPKQCSESRADYHGINAQ
jgi:hypothetical protein